MSRPLGGHSDSRVRMTCLDEPDVSMLEVSVPLSAATPQVETSAHTACSYQSPYAQTGPDSPACAELCVPSVTTGKVPIPPSAAIPQQIRTRAYTSRPFRSTLAQTRNESHVEVEFGYLAVPTPLTRIRLRETVGELLSLSSPSHVTFGECGVR